MRLKIKFDRPYTQYVSRREVYLGPCQISMIEFLSKYSQRLKSIIDVLQNPTEACLEPCQISTIKLLRKNNGS